MSHVNEVDARPTSSGAGNEFLCVVVLVSGVVMLEMKINDRILFTAHNSVEIKL